MRFLDRIRRRKGGATTTYDLRGLPDVNRGGVVFYWESNEGERRSLDDAEALEHALPRARQVFSDLELLADEGYVQGNVMPFSTVAEFEPIELAAFGLELSQGWKAEARPSAPIGRGSPKVRIHWQTPWDDTFVGEGNDRFVPVDCGFWDRQHSRLHILPREFAKMRARIASQPERFDRVSDEYAFLQQVQELAEQGADVAPEGGLAVSQQLKSERYLVPRADEVKAEIRPTPDGGLEIRPTLPGHESFEAADELMETGVAPVMSRQTGLHGRGRERIAYDEEVRQRIDVIRAVPKVPAAEVEEFAQDPGRYVESRVGRARPDLAKAAAEMDFSAAAKRLAEIDVANFGPRVRGEVEYVPGPSYAPRGGPGLLSIAEDDARRVPTPKTEDDSSPEGVEKPPVVVLEVADNVDELEFSARTAEALRSQLTRYTVSGAFQGRLRPHQEEGHVWLRNLWDAAQNEAHGQGGLLADEMGLGKTVQVAALLAHLHETRALRPSLIVGPGAVVRNWLDEIEKFIGRDVDVYQHRGPSRTRDPAELVRHDIVAVTYDTMANDQRVFARIPFQVAVLDEAHYIKNHGTKRSRASRALDAKLRLALSATPVENRLEELWAVIEFAQPGLLGTMRQFMADVVRPIEGGGKRAAEASSRTLQTLGPHYLRRMKSLLTDLPEKTVDTCAVKMTEFERTVYEAVVAEHRSGQKGALAAINELVVCSTHPWALRDRAHELGLADLFDQHDGDPNAIVRSSGKFQFMMDKLREIERRGEKAVIFTSRRVLQPLVQMAVRHEFGFRPVVVNGEQSATARYDEIQRFQRAEGFGVIVLSPQATGLGLNITAANHVIHLTREWNPSKENQATDRVHRIGQTRPVAVHVPIATADGLFTVDQRIDQLMREKAELADSVIRKSSDLSFSVEAIGVVLTEDSGSEVDQIDEMLEVEEMTMKRLRTQPSEVRAPVKKVALPDHVRAVGAGRKVAEAEAFVQQVFESGSWGRRLRERQLDHEGARTIMVALMQHRRPHLHEVARSAGVTMGRTRRSLGALKTALNVRGVPVLSSDDEGFYHLDVERLRHGMSD